MPGPANRVPLWFSTGHYELITSHIPLWIWDSLWAHGTTTPPAPSKQEGGFHEQRQEPTTSRLMDLTISEEIPHVGRNNEPTIGDPKIPEPFDAPHALWNEHPSQAPSHRKLDERGPQSSAVTPPPFSWPGSLYETATLLQPRPIAWWKQAKLGIVGALVGTVHGQTTRATGRDLWVAIRPEPSQPLSEQCAGEGDTTPPRVRLICDGSFRHGLTHDTASHVQIIYATKVVTDPLTLRISPEVHPLSGVYPLFPDTGKLGVADLACGVGGFSFASAALDMPVVFALDANQQAVEAYRSLHHPSHPCLLADLSDPNTLWQVLHSRAATMAIGFPCQPYSTAGYQRAFQDHRAAVVHMILVYAAVTRPLALALECVNGFSTVLHGECARQLREALAMIEPVFCTLAETTCLRPVRPLKRDRWLALCPRYTLWHPLTQETKRGILSASWTPQISTLASLGLPRTDLPSNQLVLPAELRNLYDQRQYRPRNFHSRYIRDWDHIPTITHSYGSEFGPCPCGCRNGGIKASHLRHKGVFSILVDTTEAARFLHPQEVAQIMGFPQNPLWSNFPPAQSLALLGNAVSPLHAIRVLGKIAMLLQHTGQPGPNPIPRAVAASLHQADRGPLIPQFHTHAIDTDQQERRPGGPLEVSRTHEPGRATRNPARPRSRSRTPPPNRPPVQQRNVLSPPALTRPESRGTKTTPPAAACAAPDEALASGTSTGSAACILLWVQLPNGRRPFLNIWDRRSLSDMALALFHMGHIPSLRGFFSYSGRPMPMTATIASMKLPDNQLLTWNLVEESLPTRLHSDRDLRGGLDHDGAGITQLPFGQRENVFEVTLFIHSDLRGRVDIQVAPTTPVTALLGYVARLLPIPPIHVELLHTSAGSIDDSGPFFRDLPGVSLYDSLTVHRRLALTVDIHLYGQTTAGQETVVQTWQIALEARTDTTSERLWDQIFHHMEWRLHALDPPMTPNPYCLRATQPVRFDIGGTWTLWEYEELPPTVTHLTLLATMGPSQNSPQEEPQAPNPNPEPSSHALFGTPGTPVVPSASRDPITYRDISPTRPWPPRPDSLRGGAHPGVARGQTEEPSVATGAVVPPPGLPPPLQIDTTFNPAAAVAEFLDSILSVSSTYGQALSLAEGTSAPTNPIAIHQARDLGEQIFRDWSTLESVLHMLHYRVQHGCPWRRLGIARLEGPPPSRETLDFRFKKAVTLLQVPLDTAGTPEEALQPARIIQSLQQAYHEVLEELPQVLRERAREPTSLTPMYAELPEHLLRSLTAAMQSRGRNWRSAVMFSNTQEIPIDSIPGCLPVTDARYLYDQVVRSPELGINALTRLGAQSGILIWAPLDQDRLHRLIKMYELAAVRMEDTPVMILAVPYDPYPGVECTALLSDLWRHPLQQQNKHHIIRDIQLIPMPIRCTLTGAHGPRQVDKALAFFTLTGSRYQGPLHLPWRQPQISLPTGPVLLVDGPAEDFLQAQKAVHQAQMPGLVRCEGPLRSFATTNTDQRFLMKLFFSPEVTSLHMDMYTSHLRTHQVLSQMALGSEALFADPTALRLEMTSPEMIPQVNSMLEQIVMVSPRLALAHTQHTAEEWARVLTAMHHFDPARTIPLITWRRSHQRPHIFAAPDRLQTQANAERLEMMDRERRPSPLRQYRRDLVTIEVRGTMGPDPDQLLAALVTEMGKTLGRAMVHGRKEMGLEPSQFWARRDATGAWTGTMVVLLPGVEDAVALHGVLEGGTVQVGVTFATITVRNQRLDADPALCHPTPGNGQGDGR